MASNRIVRNSAGKSNVWKHFGFFTSEDGTPVKDNLKQFVDFVCLKFRTARTRQICVCIWNDTIEANTRYC